MEIFVFRYYELLTTVYSLRRGRKYCGEIVFAKPWHSFNFSSIFRTASAPVHFLARVHRRSQLRGMYKNSVEKFQSCVSLSCLLFPSPIRELPSKIYVLIESFAKHIKAWADTWDIKSTLDKTRQLFCNLEKRKWFGGNVIREENASLD